MRLLAFLLILSWLMAAEAWVNLQSSSSLSSRPNLVPTKGKFNDSTLDWDWRTVAKEVFASDKRPVLLFDGICNFCNGGVLLCLDWDSDERFRFASLQSKTGQALLIRSGKRPDDWSSLVLVTEDNAFFESEAVLRVAQGLKGLPAATRWSAQLMRKLVPKFARDFLYHIVAENRYVFGEVKECRIDWDGSLQKRFVEDPEPCTIENGDRGR